MAMTATDYQTAAESALSKALAKADSAASGSTNLGSNAAVAYANIAAVYTSLFEATKPPTTP